MLFTYEYTDSIIYNVTVITVATAKIDIMSCMLIDFECLSHEYMRFQEFVVRSYIKNINSNMFVGAAVIIYYFLFQVAAMIHTQMTAFRLCVDIVAFWT